MTDHGVTWQKINLKEVNYSKKKLYILKKLKPTSDILELSKLAKNCQNIIESHISISKRLQEFSVKHNFCKIIFKSKYQKPRK